MGNWGYNPISGVTALLTSSFWAHFVGFFLCKHSAKKWLNHHWHEQTPNDSSFCFSSSKFEPAQGTKWTVWELLWVLQNSFRVDVPCLHQHFTLQILYPLKCGQKNILQACACVSPVFCANTGWLSRKHPLKDLNVLGKPEKNTPPRKLTNDNGRFQENEWWCVSYLKSGGCKTLKNAHSQGAAVFFPGMTTRFCDLSESLPNALFTGCWCIAAAALWGKVMLSKESHSAKA